ncbi:MAG: heavy-metal-associated domain-containing protein [Bacteroidetes bacterium]|nr:heavy-metal-associated domain-containing protein [Bacteroidota bacterium]
MKFKILSVAVLLAVGVVAVKGVAVEKESFKVSGKCGMCETRIEKAALSVRGVESADWDKETGSIEVEYAKKANADKIQKAIATAGHDTELYKANDKVYNKLPGCCKYDRAGAKSSACCSDSASDSAKGCGSSAAACGSAKEKSCPEKK